VPRRLPDGLQPQREVAGLRQAGKIQATPTASRKRNHVSNSYAYDLSPRPMVTLVGVMLKLVSRRRDTANMRQPGRNSAG
jgi:hypothetical protein